tara:strand:+ start:730 stop:1374 length:645 start_codon:yes stop_codon:yes gene_type:complete
MPSPLFKGSTSFRQIDSEETVNPRGPDTLGVTLRGKYSELDAEKALWPKGTSGSSLGYPNMWLKTRRARRPAGSFANLVLMFEGYIDSTVDNPISVEDDISLQSTALTSDEANDSGQPENVQVKFYGQVTTTRWIHYGTLAPASPRYRITVAANISTNAIFDPFPVQYNGTLQSKVVGRLIGFSRTRLTDGVWLIVESWQNRVEPATDVTISIT